MKMTLRAGVVAILCVVAMAVGITAGVVPAAAQEDVPSLPAAYHGEVTLSDGEIDQRIKIDAVADGEIQESIITDSDGQIGGPTISDDKLGVQEPDNGTVEFHIGGEPVTIRSLEGEAVNSDSIAWQSETQEIQLETTQQTIEPAFGLSITEVPDSVESGNELTTEVEIQNEGPVEASTTVELLDFNQEVVDSDTVTADIEGTATTTLTWTTDETIDTTDTITVRAGNTTATATVEVSRTEPPNIAEPPAGGQGGTGGIPTTGGSSDDTVAIPEGAIHAEERNIVSDSDFNLSQVRFTNASAVESVTWDGTRFKGEVKATTYNQTPEEISKAPGGVVSIAEITAPQNATTEPATIQFSITPDQLEEAGAEADSIRIYHLINEEWVSQETRVIEQSAQKVVLQTEVSQLSFFAVSAVGSPTAAFELQPAEPTAGETVTLTARNSSNQYGEITAYEWNVSGESFQGETVNTTFEEGGEINIELTVRNDAGETDTTTKSVSVGTSGGIPGFTVVLAMIAILGSAFTLRRRVE